MLDRVEEFGSEEKSDVLQPVFARHETFAPRYGWLKKGFDAALARPDVFLQRDAPITLGVGKNMVRAIRYWGEAFKVLARRPNKDRPRLFDAVPTEFGEALLSDDGWDPYLESPASLWLLHWKLLEFPCVAPSWYFALAQPGAVAATADAVLTLIQRSCADRPEWGDVATNSLRKDVRCLLRMYASVTSGRDLLEDTIDSPFSELGLVRELPGSPKTLTFVEGPKPGLADDVVAYASLCFATRQSEGVTPLSRLASEPGSPGVVFRLSEVQLGEALERASNRHKGLAVTTSAAAPVFVYSSELGSDPDNILRGFYVRGRGRAVAA
jgi:hypothetical protein